MWCGCNKNGPRFNHCEPSQLPLGGFVFCAALPDDTEPEATRFTALILLNLILLNLVLLNFDRHQIAVRFSPGFIVSNHSPVRPLAGKLVRTNQQQ